MAQKNLLDIRDLTIEFHTHRGIIKAIKNLNLTIKRGETLAMVGESGCGKSITAHSIMGLLPTPLAKIPQGQIYFDDLDLLSLRDRQMREVRGSQISMIFQEPMSSLNPTLKIETQLIDVIRTHQDLSNAQARAQAQDLLAQVKIPNPKKNMKSYPFQLSGGMQQRVMIALALSNPSLKLIIADEPTTALDVTIQAQILDILKELKQRSSLSLLLITHDMGVVAEVADRVIVLYSGKKVEEGNVYSIFDKPSHPYTRGLLESIPYFRKDGDRRLRAIPGTVPDLLHNVLGCPFASRCSFVKDICTKEFPKPTEISEDHTSFCHAIDEINLSYHQKKIPAKPAKPAKPTKRKKYEDTQNSRPELHNHAKK